jgi:hypothetical protein
MFTPIIRIILVIISLLMAVFFYSKEDFGNMSILLLAAGLFIYGYFKYGTVYAAFQHMKKNNLKKAEELISKIKNPKILSKGQKSYYHFTAGIIALEKQEFEKSHSELTKALNIGLRTDNDTSIVLLNLASIELIRNNFNQAKDFIGKIRTFNLKPIIESETNRIENEINIAQQNL